MRLLFALILVVVALLLVAFLLLVRPAMAGTTHCTTYQEKTLGRLQTVCDDGTRAVSTWSKTLERWRAPSPLRPQARPARGGSTLGRSSGRGAVGETGSHELMAVHLARHACADVRTCPMRGLVKFNTGAHEEGRMNTDQPRPQDTEAQRQRAEIGREKAEAHREDVEADRLDAEHMRRMAEDMREQHENMRRYAEDMRQTAEALRLVHEKARQTAEELRREAEETRQIVQDAAVRLREVAEMQARIVAQLARTTQVLRQMEQRFGASEDEPPDTD